MTPVACVLTSGVEFTAYAVIINFSNRIFFIVQESVVIFRRAKISVEEALSRILAEDSSSDEEVDQLLQRANVDGFHLNTDRYYKSPRLGAAFLEKMYT